MTTLTTTATATTSIAIGEEQILTALRDLDSGQRAEVVNFIGYLHYQAQKTSSRSPKRSLLKSPSKVSTKPRTMTASALLSSGLVGLWENRTDIGDSAEFAR